MDSSRLPEPLRRRIEERSAQPPLEKVRHMLSLYVEDALDFEEVRREIRETARTSTFYLEQYLVALETILSEPQEQGTLLRLVEVDANMGIDHDQTDRGAAVVLQKIADMLRAVIEEARGGR